MIRHPRGENSISWLFHFPLIIPSVPVNLAKIECGRGLAKDFTILLTNAPNDRFRREKVYGGFMI